MPLKKTREELYKPESEVEKRIEKREDIFDPEKAKLSAEEKFKGKKTWTKMVADLYWQKKEAIIVGIIIIVSMIVVAAAVVGAVYYKRTSFSEDRVGVSIAGPESVAGAEVVTYKIAYENNNRASLENVEIFLNHSNNFKPESASVELERQGDNNTMLKIGSIESNGKGEIEVSGRFYAPKDYVVYLKPTLRFVPSNFSSPFEVSSQIGVNVATAPISMNINASGEALNRGVTEYAVTYKNTSDIDFSNVKISLEYPGGFSFLNADQSPIESDNVWYVANLKAGDEGKIVVRGSLDGSPGDAKVVRVVLGVRSDAGGFVLYNKREDVTRIVESPLRIDVPVDKKKETNVSLGKSIPVMITYSNSGDKGLRDGVISLGVDNPMINLEELALSKGQYIVEEKSIVWKAGDIAHLGNFAPGEEGRIDFNLPIKDELLIESKDEKNFQMDSVAKIESSDVLYGTVGNVAGYSPKATLKLNSKMMVKNVLRYEDSNIANSGPIPLKLNEETTYTVEWAVENWFNEVDNAEVRAYLTTGVKWKGAIFPEGENISFNERTSEVVWKLGSMENFVGVTDSPRTVKFQIGIVPGENLIGTSPILIKNVDLTAHDLFTNESVGHSLDRVNTRLDNDDPRSKDGRHSVVLK
jgi:hypothetical protein